ncbi:hypothetical protein SAMN04487947_2031 [Halogeometricum rufum]|uniref:Uncharacterized protein n=1 Tax=Halogeometricum rufum TaxID=553469 RepID=A0A1I6HGD0_9EURY|nr:hypothetical protein [Halogeometricum rufum]SFR53428.1 hypothetical protein SAMN04487947_2031 [Halogeometricum rufum]
MAENRVPNIIYNEPEGREARIARDANGVAIGVALFFTPGELAAVGVDPAKTDVVRLRFVDGEIDLIPAEAREYTSA